MGIIRSVAEAGESNLRSNGATPRPLLTTHSCGVESGHGLPSDHPRTGWPAPPLPAGWRCALLLCALVAGALVFAPGPVPAQTAPDGEWATRTTEHLRVTYPADHPEMGERVAVRAEAAYRLLSRALLPPPAGRLDVVVTDDTDVSNGRATVFPTNRTVIVASPPMDGLSLSHFDDWLDLVLVHEMAHLFHLDESGGPGSVVRALFGRAPLFWPPFPGVVTPAWTREGLATWYESDLTSAGRNRGSYFDMILRTAWLEGRFEDLDQASGTSPVWPHGVRPYLYGGEFFGALVDQGSPEDLTEFVNSYAGRWIPFRLSASTEDAFGVDVDEAWEAWRDEGREEALSLRDSLAAMAPLSTPEERTAHGRWALRPLPSPDGEWVAYTRSDGRSDPQIHLLPEGRKLTRTSGLADVSWTPDGAIVFAQLEFSDRYRLRSDLHRVDLDGDVRRLTRGERLDHPTVGPDGEVAVAIQWGEGTNRLVEVDLADGSVRPLTTFDPEVHWAYPSIAPDGTLIAASRWTEGGYYDVVVLDRDGGGARRVTRDRAVDMAPTWSPDGRWLLWSSDRTGIWNVVALPVARLSNDTDSDAASDSSGPGSPAGSAPPDGLVQLTHVVTGALYPAVDPAGRWLYFSGYHADGWRIERIPFEPEAGLAPLPADPRVVPSSGSGGPPTSPVAEARSDTVPGEVGPYSAVPSLWPRYWLPDYGSAEDALLSGRGPVEVFGPRLGARTSGRDLLGRHGYAVRAGVTLGDGRLQGAARYSWSGLGNPVLGGFVYQDWDAFPRSVRLTGPDGDEDVIPVERERAAGLSVGFLRRRYRDVLGLTVSGAFIRQHDAFLSLSGDGSGELRESELFRPSLPDRDLLEASVTLSGDHTRRHPFSISLEDGVQGAVTARRRWELDLPGSAREVAGVDRSYLEGLGELRLYKSLGGPGFANHVLATRASGGVAGGPDALAFHFEVGGNRGSPETVSGFGLLGGETAEFPVRGFDEGVRFGRYAWSGSLEYRFPLWLVHRGLGFFPLHFDRMSGSLFFDAGNAWGPELAGGTDLPLTNPRRDPIASAGAEVSTIILPLWTGDVVLRTGVAVPIQGGEGTSFYLRIGPSF